MAHGLRLLARNVRCGRGELDLVMLDREVLVFVEVRFRGRNAYSDGAASVTPRKVAHIIRAARLFLARNVAHAHRRCRFDVVSVSQRDYAASCGHAFRFRWIRDAFGAG